MKVYRLLPDVEHYSSFVVDDSTLDTLKLGEQLCERESLRKTWKPFRISRSLTGFTVDEPNMRANGDCVCIFLTPAVVLSQIAISALSDLLEENGELLPLTSNDGDFYLYHVTSIVDALDHKRAHLRYWSKESVRDVKHYSFDELRIEQLSIFRLPETRRIETLVTDAFVQETRVHSLGGFEFEELS